MSKEFEKERLSYCESMYALEKERRNILERQAQFYLGIITLFLGIIALKSEVLSAIRAVLGQSSAARILVYSEMVLFFCSLLAALVAILLVFKPERRHKPYPSKIVTALFADDSKESTEQTEESFIKDCAIRFAIAVEKNNSYNTKKSKWLVVAAISCLATILSYIVFVATVLFRLI